MLALPIKMSEDATRDIRLTALADLQAKLNGVLEQISRLEETVQERLYDTRPNVQMLNQQMEGVIERLDHIEQKMDVLGLDGLNTRANLASTIRRVEQLH
jgi:ABC-type transporter Mla subunit MlaD